MACFGKEEPWGSLIMTNPTIPGSAQQDLEGRSVREVVQYSPGEVNDAWCRKILRKILQSLDLQYAMQMPHRAITPDTIVFHANGEPLLISNDIDAAPAPDAQQADDLTALAGVIHYAITQELAPAGPLNGRVDSYSAVLVAAIDACMDPDAARRPRSIDAMRGLLGFLAPAPLAGAVILSASASASASSPAPVDRAVPGPVAGTVAPPDAVVKAHRPGTRRSQRWVIAAGGGALAIVIALVSFTEFDHVVRAPVLPAPGAPPPVLAQDAAGGVAGNVSASPAFDPADSAASGASSGGATASGGDVDERSGMPRVAPAKPPAVSARAGKAAQVNGESTANARAAVPASAVSAHASYQLQIEPWGNVFVDGVDRGVSPPLRRLVLQPGPHTIRITHPHYRDSILEFESASTTSNGKIIVDFNREAK